MKTTLKTRIVLMLYNSGQVKHNVSVAREFTGKQMKRALHSRTILSTLPRVKIPLNDHCETN